jgi:hypothetical protein
MLAAVSTVAHTMAAMQAFLVDMTERTSWFTSHGAWTRQCCTRMHVLPWSHKLYILTLFLILGINSYGCTGLWFNVS